jgi:hypothetical protein
MPANVQVTLSRGLSFGPGNEASKPQIYHVRCLKSLFWSAVQAASIKNYGLVVIHVETRHLCADSRSCTSSMPCSSQRLRSEQTAPSFR